MKKHSKSLRAFTVMALFSLVMVMLFVVASGSVSLASATAATDTAVTNTANDELNETAVYIIQLSDVPLASYRGEIEGLAPTNPGVSGQRKLDLNSAASRAYLNHLQSVQDTFVANVEATLGRSVDVRYNYQVAFNGVAITLSQAEAAQVATLDGVTLIERETQEVMLTDTGPAFIGAPGIWDGTATGGLNGTYGEGVIVGIIDSGINVVDDHPSFSAVGGDGYVHTNPLSDYVGICAGGNTNPDLTCNDKMIGYRGYNGETPGDSDGHGSHTASTVAGNFTQGHITATIPVTLSISGVAPHANIISYDACVTSCPGAGLLAAVNDAVADGVDVINYSISGGSNPYFESVELAFLAARDAGVFVSASAGNNGPGAGTVAHVSPWLTTVAASTHSRTWLNQLADMSGGGTPPPDLSGRSISAGYGPAPIVHAGDYGDPLCGTPFPAGTWSGEIVVCDRGIYGRVEKGANVLAGGAGGYVLANVAANGESINADAHVLPAIHLGFANGEALRTWLASGSGHMATITEGTYTQDPALGDVMAGFSSRGPVGSLPDLVKPDVTAPGVDIFAAYAYPVNFEFLSGTSMSSPHNAGAGALLTALHPDWTPAEIQSALMTTAINTGIVKEDGTTPADLFDMGAGRVNLNQAGMAGLVLNETLANYQAANPADGGDPKTLNTPSMGNAQCEGSCSWTRTVRSTAAYTSTWSASFDGAMDVDWSVTPDTFTLAPGASQTLTVTADVSGAMSGEWYFGQLMLTNTSTQGNTAYLRVAHLAPFAMDPGTAVTVTLDGAPVLTNFAYGDSTNYLAVEAGDYLVEVYPAGSATPAISGNVSLTGGMSYTAIAIGDGANQSLSLLALVDDNTAPAAGKFHLRLGHLAPFASVITDTLADIRLQDGTPILTNVPYGAVAGYIPLDAGTYDLKITTPGGAVTLIDPEPATFAEGQVVYAFATGEGANQALGVFAYPSVPDAEGFFLPLTPPGYDLYLPVIINAGTLSQPAATPARSGYNVVDAPMVVDTAPAAHFPIAVKPFAPPIINVDPTSLSSSLDTGSSETQPITVTNTGGSDLNWSVYEGASAPEMVDWSDNFDSYATGSQIHGQGDWKGWANDPAAGALVVSTQARSAPNSVEIVTASDLVHEYSGYDDGFWTYTAWQYMPSDFSGESYFLLLNQYDDAGATNNWSVQVHFNSTSGLVIADGVGAGNTLPLVTGQWVELRVEIDLVNDFQEFYYDGQMLYSGSWSDGVSGGGITSIGAVDLYANGASAVYYDDLSLVETVGDVCDLPGDYPWLSVTPGGGTTAAGDSSVADVTFDATGLASGGYSGTLCFTSDDPATPLVQVPVDLTVTGTPPIIEIDPMALDSSQNPDTQFTQTLTISNTGGGTLDWMIDEAPAAAAGPTVVLYDNGPLVNSPGTGAGGADESVLQSTSLLMTTLGFGHQVLNNNWMADDFTVTDAEGWTIDAMTFYAYQTGSTTTSTMTNVNWLLYDGDPSAGGMVIASGSGLDTTVWSNIYRVSETTPGATNRPIMADTVNTGGVYLPAGTYWVAWQTDGTLASGPWAPPITINGQTTTGNGLQSTGGTAAWVPANDGGTLTQQGLPFVLEGSIGNTSSCTAPSDLPWLSVNPMSGSNGAGSSSAVDVVFDSTGLAPDTYSGTLCVNSNDPVTPLVEVPVSLTVVPTAPSLVPNGAAIDFESGLPYDWTTDVITGSVYWSTTNDGAACSLSRGNQTPGSGNAACADSDVTNNAGDPYDAAMVTNPFDLTGYGSATLTFAAAYNDITPAGGDMFQVDVWDGVTWTNLLSWDEDHYAPGEIVNLDLSAYAGMAGLQVRFHYFGDGWDWWAQVDDVSVTAASLGLNGPAVAFETGLPTDWTTDVITGSVYWSTTNDGAACSLSRGNQTPGSGNAACADSDVTNGAGNPYDAAMVTNPVDLTGATAITLTFAAAYNDITAAGGDMFQVDVWDGVTWTNVLSWDEDHYAPGEIVNLNLDAYAGSTVQIRFHYFGNGWDWWAQVDDVSLTGN